MTSEPGSSGFGRSAARGSDADVEMEHIVKRHEVKRLYRRDEKTVKYMSGGN